MTPGNTTAYEVPTHRDIVKGGSAVIGGGLLAGCASNSDQTPTPTETETEPSTPTETETDTSYDVEVKPYGSVTFEEVPETYVTMGSGAWPDLGFAFGREPIAMSRAYYPLQYYEALPDVSFDADSVTDLGNVSALDVEQFFETDADVHIIDKILRHPSLPHRSHAALQQLERYSRPLTRQRTDVRPLDGRSPRRFDPTASKTLRKGSPSTRLSRPNFRSHLQSHSHRRRRPPFRPN